uniref:Uncharacterized protein n=1 Tax=Hyaloperonospora arabidopsidis (strain Emoy2) TaxID=559515 RepID=M4BS15_HYAAE
MAPLGRKRGVEWAEFDYVEKNGQLKVSRVAFNHCASNVTASSANMRTHLKNARSGNAWSANCRSSYHRPV